MLLRGGRGWFEVHVWFLNGSVSTSHPGGGPVAACTCLLQQGGHLGVLG